MVLTILPTIGSAMTVQKYLYLASSSYHSLGFSNSYRRALGSLGGASNGNVITISKGNVTRVR